MGYIYKSGITVAHFGVFQRVAQEKGCAIIVRNTNPKSTPWIDQGYPPKPKILEALHTSATTGKVTARSENERQMARNAGFYVIDNDGVARRMPGEALQKRFPFKTPEMNESGQVIHPHLQRALVGDYDLMGVINPASKKEKQTSKEKQIVIIFGQRFEVENFTSPYAQDAINRLNRQMDQPRVMHGPQDLYGGFKGACTGFLPNGLTWEMTTEQSVVKFYELMERNVKG